MNGHRGIRWEKAVNAKRITVQHLIDSLDDARLLYEKATDKVADPRLRDLLDCTIGRHWLIADDLARQIVRTSGEVTRHGSRLGRLRTFVMGKVAQHSIDSDMAYVSQASKCEASILLEFRQLVASGQSSELCWRLRAHCRGIESAAIAIGCLRTSLGLQMGARSRAGGLDHVDPRRAPARPALMANRHHADA